MEFRVWDLRFGVLGLAFGVWGLGLGVPVKLDEKRHVNIHSP